MNLQEIGTGWMSEMVRVASSGVVGAAKPDLGVDVTIEGLRSQFYSVMIFGFLIVSLVLFGGFVYAYITRSKAKLKTGEKYMFGAIIAGMVFAVIFGWTQLIEGILF